MLPGGGGLALLRRYVDLFDPGRCPEARTLLELIISDYLAYYGAWETPGYKVLTGRDRPKFQSQRRLALLFIPRLISNPCFHATILFRLAMASPTWTLGLWRTILIAKHSCDLMRNIRIGPGLVMPHPIGIYLGNGLHIGSRVTVLNNVSIGTDLRKPAEKPPWCPTIGDDVVILAYSFLLGDFTVGDGALIRARAWVTKDVAPGEVVKADPPPASDARVSGPKAAA